jgi:alkylated DNA repair dioxygenase AlkB
MTRDKNNLNKWALENYHKKKLDKDFMEKKRESARKYYQANKEKCKKARKDYFETHKEEYRKYRREYRYTSPVGIYSVIKDGLTRSGEHRKNLLKISKEDFIKWWNKQEQVCHYCKRTLTEIAKENDRLNRKCNRLTVDRLDNNKGYENGNLALSCMRCNGVKSDYFTEEEMLKIGKIIYDKNH